jgi:O-antigen/teichoic acid export membrane protein
MRQKLARNTAFLTAGSILGALSGFGFNALVAQTFGPDNFGRLSLAIMTVSITASISLLGLPDGIINFVSRYRAEDDHSSIVGTISAGLIFGGLVSLIGSILIYTLAPIIANQIFNDAKLTNILQLISFSLPGLVLLRLLAAVTMGYERGEYKVLIKQIGRRGVLLMLTVAVIGFNFRFEEIVYSYVVSAWVSAIIGVVILIWLIQTWPVTINWPGSDLMNYSVPLLFSKITGEFSNWVDTFLVGIFISSTAVGFYQASFLLGANILIINASVSQSFFPEVSSLLHSDERKDATKRYQSSVKWIVAITFGPGIYLVVFPQLSLGMVFGSEFSTASLALVIITLGNLGAALTGPATEVIKADGFTRFIFVTQSIALFMNTIINIITLPVIGIVGAALGTAAATLIANGSHLLVMKRWCNVHPSISSLWFLPIVIFVSAVPSLLTVRFVDSALGFLVHIGLFSVLYVGGLILTRTVTWTDLHKLRSNLS